MDSIDRYWENNWKSIDINKILNNRIVYYENGTSFIQNQITDELSESNIYEHVIAINPFTPDKLNLSADILIWNNDPIFKVPDTDPNIRVGSINIKLEDGGEISNCYAINSAVYDIITKYLGYKFIIPKTIVSTVPSLDVNISICTYICLDRKIMNNESLSVLDLYKFISTNMIATNLYHHPIKFSLQDNKDIEFDENISILYNDIIVQYNLRKGPVS